MASSANELEKRRAYPFFTKESEKLKTKGYRRFDCR